MNRSIEVVVRVWLKGRDRDISFCGSKWIFRNKESVRKWLKKLVKNGEVLEFAGCGWHMVFEDGRYWWSRCKWLE